MNVLHRINKFIILHLNQFEQMPFYNNKWNTDHLVNYRQMMNTIETYYDTPLTKLQDSPNDTTKWYSILNNSKRRIEFITSMSDYFCNTCNRLRITANRQLKVCFFGEQEINLRALLRREGMDEDELKLIIEASVKSKFFKSVRFESSQEIAEKNSNCAMTLIGN